MKRTGAGAWLRSCVRRCAPPPALATAMLVFLATANTAWSAMLTLVVLKKDGKPLAGAVVTAEPDTPRPLPAAPTQAIVDQMDLAFVPDVSVIPVGSSLSFPNSDAVSHQVYSFSPARRFQLPLYRGKPYPPVVFDRPGIVTLGCNIHDNMLAYVVVTNAPFYGRTNKKGEWSAANAPEGSYRIRLWHPLLKEPAAMLERPAQLDGSGSTITLKLDESLRPPPLKSHPHSWDY